MGRVTQRLIPIERDTLEATARVMGPSSASAKALDDADQHDGPVRFFRLGQIILVEKAAVAEQYTRLSS